MIFGFAMRVLRLVLDQATKSLVQFFIGQDDNHLPQAKCNPSPRKIEEHN